MIADTNLKPKTWVVVGPWRVIPGEPPYPVAPPPGDDPLLKEFEEIVDKAYGLKPGSKSGKGG
jgi:hypothetical protein